MVEKVSLSDHINKDGKYLYDGVMTKHDLDKLVAIAEKNHLVGLSPNDYIAYVIRHYYDQNQ